MHQIHQVCLGLKALGNATIRSSQGFQEQVVFYNCVPLTFLTPNVSYSQGSKVVIDGCVIFYPTQINFDIDNNKKQKNEMK